MFDERVFDRFHISGSRVDFARLNQRVDQRQVELRHRVVHLNRLEDVPPRVREIADREVRFRQNPVRARRVFLVKQRVFGVVASVFQRRFQLLFGPQNKIFRFDRFGDDLNDAVARNRRIVPFFQDERDAFFRKNFSKVPNFVRDENRARVLNLFGENLASVRFGARLAQVDHNHFDDALNPDDLNRRIRKGRRLIRRDFVPVDDFFRDRFRENRIFLQIGELRRSRHYVEKGRAVRSVFDFRLVDRSNP